MPVSPTLTVSAHHRSKTRAAVSDAVQGWRNGQDQAHPVFDYADTAVTRAAKVIVAAVESGAAGEYASATATVNTRLPDEGHDDAMHQLVVTVDEATQAASDAYESDAVLEEKAKAEQERLAAEEEAARPERERLAAEQERLAAEQQAAQDQRAAEEAAAHVAAIRQAGLEGARQGALEAARERALQSPVPAAEAAPAPEA